MYFETANGGIICFTLNPETTAICSHTMQDKLKVVSVIKSHAKAYWGYNATDLKQIRLGKTDIARDNAGSFIPDVQHLAFDAMSETLRKKLECILSSYETNFLSTNAIGDLTITKASKNLETCFKFDVEDDERVTILIVKVYDKDIDLISRDGS